MVASNLADTQDRKARARPQAADVPDTSARESTELDDDQDTEQDKEHEAEHGDDTTREGRAGVVIPLRATLHPGLPNPRPTAASLETSTFQPLALRRPVEATLT